jgi:hypothetical protein
MYSTPNTRFRSGESSSRPEACATERRVLARTADWLLWLIAASREMIARPDD